MIHLITELSKYVMIILFAIYTWYSYVVLAVRNEERQKRMYKTQTTCMFLIHLDAFMVLFAVTKELKVLIFYGAQVLFVLFLFLIYRIVYKKAARLVINHMCMLMLIGFIILTRLNFDNAVRQFEIAVAAAVVSAFVPMLVRKLKFLRKFTWFYCAVGVVALGIVLVMGKMSGGAHLSFTVAGVTLQPSEFVKIIFVFFVACMLYEATDFRQVCITTIAAAVHVGILVLSTDLGAALIFFLTYVVMLYVATRKPSYFFGGLGVGCLAALVGSKLFSHVRVRIEAWKDPFASIHGGGWQVAQALFAIGTYPFLKTERKTAQTICLPLYRALTAYFFLQSRRTVQSNPGPLLRYPKSCLWFRDFYPVPDFFHTSQTAYIPWNDPWTECPDHSRGLL